MTEPVSKAVLRAAVLELSGKTYIYSTANLKSTNEYRMSLGWHGGYRNARFADVKPEHWQDCDQRRDQLIHQLEDRFPQLRGHIRGVYHIASGIYLGLRVDNHVLTAR